MVVGEGRDDSYRSDELLVYRLLVQVMVQVLPLRLVPDADKCLL